ncbi:MAG: hypothetical protein AB7M12_11000 [Hyphomonadaceae bacterium]
MISDQAASTAIGILVFLYLGSLLLVAGHLRRNHADVWDSLYKPSLLNWSVLSSFKLGRYALFSGAYVHLNDKMLSRLILSARAITILMVLAMAAWLLHRQL